MASGNITVRMTETHEFKAAMELLRQFVDYGNQQYVPDEDMESLMAEAETFLDHGLDGLRAEEASDEQTRPVDLLAALREARDE